MHPFLSCSFLGSSSLDDKDRANTQGSWSACANQSIGSVARITNGMILYKWGTAMAYQVRDTRETLHRSLRLSICTMVHQTWYMLHSKVILLTWSRMWRHTSGIIPARAPLTLEPDSRLCTAMIEFNREDLINPPVSWTSGSLI